MREDRYARLALDLLLRRVRSNPGDLLGDRASTLDQMRRALRRRIRRRVIGGIALAAVASLALVLGAALGQRQPPVAQRASRAGAAPALQATGTVVGTGPATLLRGGRTLPLERTAPLQAGDRLTADNAAVDVTMSTGTRLALAAPGQLEVMDLGPLQRYALHGGRLRADVAHLSPDQRFLILTEDSEIEVKGTAFELVSESGANCLEAPGTDLRVFEGMVSVRHAGEQRLVGAGQSWTSRPVVAAQAPTRGPARITGRTAVAPRPRSNLAQQNDLFTDALARHQAGDLAGALRRIDDLLRRFPRGSLADSARAERAKLAAEMRERGR